MSDFGHERAREARPQRGRPKKKPGYCKDQEIGKLLSQAVNLYGPPYDDRDGREEDAPSLADVAKQMGTSTVRVRRLLITAEHYSTSLSREVQRLQAEGKTLEEIMDHTGLGLAAVRSYLPYSKGVYNLDDPTLHAEQIRAFRKRERSTKALLKHLECAEQYLWDAIIAFEGYTFSTGEYRFSYTVSGESIAIDGVSFSKAAIMKAFRRARKIQACEGCVDQCEKMNCIGARELYAVFLRFGMISAER